jgi:hypothetical protein
MSFFDNIFGKSSSGGPAQRHGAIADGKQKKDGGHDHRGNAGKDRTPAQKEGDKKRRKE